MTLIIMVKCSENIYTLVLFILIIILIEANANSDR